MADVIKLWEGPAPGSEEAHWREASYRFYDGTLVLRNVVEPTLTPYCPEPGLANGSVVIVAPGGAFSFLTWESEGTAAAEWLARQGVTAFLLKYRVAYTGTDEDFNNRMMAAVAAHSAGDEHPQPAEPAGVRPEVAQMARADAGRAVCLVREQASTFGIRPDAVGFLGFSAGAFLAIAVALEGDSNLRPDFVAAIYGGLPLAPVTADSPPLFSAVSADDAFGLDSCLHTFQTWRAAGRPAELHVYERGGHGFGVTKMGLPVDTWPERLADWMHLHGYMP